jgi:hypothetical protein
MTIRLIAPVTLILTAACSAAAPSPEQASSTTASTIEGATIAPAVPAAANGAATSTPIQFAFFHFDNEQVRVTVDGIAVFDRAVTVAPDNARYGLAAVAQISMPACADIVVTTARQRSATRLCRTPATRSIVIDGGPPLAVETHDEFQGED